MHLSRVFIFVHTYSIERKKVNERHILNLKCVKFPFFVQHIQCIFTNLVIIILDGIPLHFIDCPSSVTFNIICNGTCMIL